MRARRGRGEGAIKERKDGRWEARVSFGYDDLGRRIRCSVYGETKVEVRKKLQGFALSGPVRSRVNGPTVAAFFTEYRNHVRVQNSVATWKLRRTAAQRYIVPLLGELKLAAVTPRHVAGLMQKLSEVNVGKRTIQDKKSVQDAPGRVFLGRSSRAAPSEPVRYCTEAPRSSGTPAAALP